MRRVPRPPPPAIVQARVLHYAVLPRSLPFAGASIFVAKKGEPLLPLARVPRLAICKEGTSKVRLTFCDARWQYVASSTHRTVPEAKRRAERAYPGVSRHWTKAHVTATAAREYLERLWGPLRCMFCLKSPLELDRDGSMVGMGRGRICSACITEFANDLAKKKLGA